MGKPSSRKSNLEFEWKKIYVTNPELEVIFSFGSFKISVWISESQELRQGCDFHRFVVYSSIFPALRLCLESGYGESSNYVERVCLVPCFLRVKPSTWKAFDHSTITQQPTNSLLRNSLGVSMFLVGRDQFWAVSLSPLWTESSAMSHLQAKYAKVGR